MEFGYGNEALMPKATQSCYPASETILQVRIGQQVFDRLTSGGRDLPPDRRQSVHLRPKPIWVAQFVQGDQAQPFVTLLQHERPSAFC